MRARIEHDTLVFEPRHHKIASDLMPCIFRYMKGNKFVLAIYGISGTGKTEVAMLLQEKLFERGMTSKIIHLDGYYRVHWRKRKEHRAKSGIIGIDEIDWLQVNKLVERFKENNINLLSIKKINLYLDEYETILVTSNFNVMIIDGLYSANVSGVNYVVKLDAEIEQTLLFQEKRGKEIMDADRSFVLEAERCEVAKLDHRNNIEIPWRENG